MTEPRNVTPDYDSGQQSRPPESFPRSGFGTDKKDSGTPPEWLAWAWASDRNRSFPWLGVLLLVIGVCLLIQYLIPALSLGTLILVTLGISLVASWVMGGTIFATIPGLLILALGVSGFIGDSGIYTGPGTTALCLAVACLGIWAIFSSRERRITWPLWGAAIFGLIGAVEVSSRAVSVPSFGGLWPALIIVIGLILVANARGNRPRARRARRMRHL